MKKPAKPPHQAVDPQPVEKRLGEAIRENDDFGHELRVGLNLHGAGADVIHGWSYSDPISGKIRQFDLRATLEHWSLPRFVHLALEAKNLAKDTALVVAGTSRDSNESFHDVVASEWSHGEVRSWIERTQGTNYAYPVNGFVGKSLLTFAGLDTGQIAKTGKESEVYDRWTQALASAHDLCKAALTAAKKPDQVTRSLILPGVVVPDGTLWAAEYEIDGELMEGHPKPVDSATLFLNHEIEVKPHNNWMNISHLHFWTLNGLRGFLESLANVKASWDEWFPASVKRHEPSVR